MLGTLGAGVVGGLAAVAWREGTAACQPLGGLCLPRSTCCAGECDRKTRRCACAEDQVRCGEQCVPSDANNCGKCGNVCGSGVCEGGVCQPNCFGGQCLYGGDCTSHFCHTDTHTCGSVEAGLPCVCNDDCHSKSCVLGTCQKTCAPGPCANDEGGDDGGSCYSGYCSGGQCQPVYTGGSCHCNSDCLSGSCNGSACD